LALAALALLGPTRHAAAAEQAPFKGRLDGVVTVAPLDPPFVAVLINGTGNATQLGLFTVSVPHTVNRAAGTGVGSYEFTAANGDKLVATFVGHATPTATPGVLYIVEVGTITGGTGRFADATGEFIVERWYSTIAGTTTGYFEGTITTP